MLQLENISWTSPDGNEILKNISVSFPEGKLVVVTGKNGGGKTTLAHIIAGLKTPDSGRIILNGADITALDITERARAGIGFAFQTPVRFKGITVRKLIEIAAGEPLSEGKLCDILGQVGLCAMQYLNREVNSTLSGGEMKRIEIATVLARGAKIVIFDEPEAGIDLWSFKNLIDVFIKIREARDKSLIIISHQERILKIADEIVMVSDGGIKASGISLDSLPQEVIIGEVKSACRMEEEIFCE